MLHFKCSRLACWGHEDRWVADRDHLPSGSSLRSSSTWGSPAPSVIPVPVCIRSLISAGNYLLFLRAPFYCCCLTHIPSLLKSHPSLVILNSQTPMPFYVFFYKKMCTANIDFYFADDKAEMYRIYASDKFGIHIQPFWLYSTVLIFWLISLSCDLALGSAETFVILTYRL